MNQLTLLGTITDKKYGEGKVAPYCRFTLVSTRQPRFAGASPETAEVKTVCFGPLAERANAAQGDVVCIGRLKSDEFQGRDGTPRKSLVFMVDELRECRADRSAADPEAGATAPAPAPINDEPPF